MKVYNWILGAGILLIASCSNSQQNVCGFVDPMIGTDAHGHTYPGATMPFGAVQLSPDTRTLGWDASSGYHYSDSTLLGFSHTHLSGTGCSDLADILIRPVTDGTFNQPIYFSHRDETAAPGYYSVNLKREGVLAELIATTHCGIHRYTYRKGLNNQLLIDLKHSLDNEPIERAMVRWNGGDEISGMRCSDGWIKGQNIYFDVKFSKPLSKVVLYNNGKAQNLSIGQTINGTDLKLLVSFDSAQEEPLVCKVGLSGESCEAAQQNLSVETSNYTFDELHNRNTLDWQNCLNAIQIEDDNNDNLTKFYTALYHSCIVPNQINDANQPKEYSTLSLWDTFRTWNPLMLLIHPDLTSDIINSMLKRYDERGELPVWPLCKGETYCMIGYHAVSVIADAYQKGMRSFDAEKALKAMKASAETDRKGSRFFNTLGYIPCDKTNESVSCALEYSYDSWCIAQMAKALGHQDDYNIYMKRAQNYKKLFDPSIRFFRPLQSDGKWLTPFDTYQTSAAFTEATPWQYRFFAPHDMDGLISLYDGKDNMVAALDSMFKVKPTIDPELPDISGYIGQYVHGNEPSHGIVYLYNYLGQPWKTQYWTRRLLDEMYKTTPDGLCGNEDCGQMSAWLVMSSLGLYPECPGSNLYSLTTPLFKKATVRLGNHKNLIIEANNPEKNRYIAAVYWNGKKIGLSIDYQQIIEGGTLRFELTSSPKQ